MTLMRFDPFREWERLADQSLSVGARAVRSMPMAAQRRGDEFLVFLDVPGVHREDIDVTVERNVVSVRARRAPAHQEGDEVIIDEQPYGEFSRQLLLGDNLDSDRMSADTRDGVLNPQDPHQRGEQAAPGAALYRRHVRGCAPGRCRFQRNYPVGDRFNGRPDHRLIGRLS